LGDNIHGEVTPQRHADHEEAQAGDQAAAVEMMNFCCYSILLQVSTPSDMMMIFYCFENMTKQIGSTLIGNKQTRARDIKQRVWKI
jgi:hypothetical protein